MSPTLDNAAAATMWSNDRASAALGMSVVEASPGRAVVTMTVRSDMLNGLDVCHGGLIFTFADTAMAFASNAHNDIAFAVSADMTWQRPTVEGDRLVATAVEQDTTGRSGVYDVTVVNQDGDVVGMFRGRVRHTGKRLVGG
jgi:phenylacetic acid degradation protein PaaD